MATDRCLNAPAVMLLALLSGCASGVGSMVADVQQHGTEVELADTPFYAQVTDQCGPSALAVVLGASGVSVSPETLKSRIYIPGREGSLQIEMLAATRAHQRIPYRIEPQVTALLDELQGDRPVLVLQNLGTRIAPVWHYAVVVGYLPDEQRFVLRSGDRERHKVRVSRFLRSWKRSDFWGFVVLTPGEIPSTADADSYVRAVAALEAVEDFQSAASAYRAATGRWPGHALAWLGLGNALYAQGELDAAEDAYATLLAAEPYHVAALNNLAHVQAGRGCYGAASETLRKALSTAKPGSPVHRIIDESLQQIGSHPDAC